MAQPSSPQGKWLNRHPGTANPGSARGSVAAAAQHALSASKQCDRQDVAQLTCWLSHVAWTLLLITPVSAAHLTFWGADLQCFQAACLPCQSLPPSCSKRKEAKTRNSAMRCTSCPEGTKNLVWTLFFFFFLTNSIIQIHYLTQGILF